MVSGDGLRFLLLQRQAKPISCVLKSQFKNQKAPVMDQSVNG
jgi:hypothetical protein